MGFKHLAFYRRLPFEDLGRPGIFGKPECPYSQSILRIESLRILPEPDLLSARVVRLRRGPSEQGFGQLLAKKSPSEDRRGEIVSLIFLRPEVEFLLLVNPGSGTELLSAPEKRCDSRGLRVRRTLAKPDVKQIEFACECVVQITVHSQITQVLLLFQWKAGIGLRLREDIERIDGFLPDIYSQERGRMQNRPGQLIGFDRRREVR